MGKWVIGWDISHQEFTITDHYYFSLLGGALAGIPGIEVRECGKWEDLRQCDVVVFNYPEKPFTKREAEEIAGWVEAKNRRVIFAGYYKDEDGVCSIINEVTGELGVRLGGNVIRDRLNCCCGDDLLIVSSQVRGIPGVSRVMFACPSEVRVSEGGEYLIMTEMSAEIFRDEEGREGEGGPVGLLARTGSLYVVGTCVFWDNFSIRKLDNFKLALYLLLPEEKYREHFKIRE